MSLPIRILWGAGGMLFLMGIAWLLSNNKKKMPWRVIGWGVGLQLIFAFLILKTGPGQWVFEFGRKVITGLLGFTDAGASFLFGSLYKGDYPIQGEGPYHIYDPSQGTTVPMGIIFAFHVLMTIVFFASLMSVLYHLGIMQFIIKWIAKGMRFAMGTSGSETLSISANIFVGQTEAPLVIRPFLAGMTKSELMAVMTGGFATVAGGVMVAYARFGIDPGHLLAATVMSAPAALVFAKIMIPETEESDTAGEIKVKMERQTTNIIDAAATGASDGMKLAINVAAMLMAFIALVAMVNFGLGLIHSDLTLATIFSYIFFPFALAMGIEPREALEVGNLLGTKIAINEFVGYIELSKLRETLSPRSFDIATYALCGFANFSSIAIQIGGISTIAPGRRKDLARLGMRAMLAGALASWQTATIAGIFIDPAESTLKRAQREQPWMTETLNYQERIDAYEQQMLDYPSTELAKQAKARIGAIRLEALQTFDTMDATAQRLLREGAPEEALKIYLRVIDEFNTPEGLALYAQDKSTVEILYHNDPAAAREMLKRLVDTYARPLSGKAKPVGGEEHLEALDASNKPDDLKKANYIRFKILDRYALVEYPNQARKRIGDILLAHPELLEKYGPYAAP